MARYRIDQFFDELLTFLRANLNDAITAMNTEKGDTLLGTVNNDAYIFQNITEQIRNFDPFIFYGIDSVASNGILGATEKTYAIDVILIKATDQNEETDDDQNRRVMLRYSEVLTELFESNFAKIHYSHNIKVSSLEPIAFNLMNSDEAFKAVGVQLEFRLT